MGVSRSVGGVCQRLDWSVYFLWEEFVKDMLGQIEEAIEIWLDDHWAAGGDT